MKRRRYQPDTSSVKATRRLLLHDTALILRRRDLMSEIGIRIRGVLFDQHISLSLTEYHVRNE